MAAEVTAAPDVPVAAELTARAERALDGLRRRGFDAAQVRASRTLQQELNISHNEPSLMRSVESVRLSLVGIVGGRRASTDLGDPSPAAIEAALDRLHEDALAAPADEGNAVSAGERARIVQGPQHGDATLLADKVAELLGFRATETPKMILDEGFASHTRVEQHTLTSGGSDLASSVGWYTLSAFGTGRDGQRSSSFNYTQGHVHDLASQHAAELFGLGQMLRDTERQIDTAPIGAKFVGDVVLTPAAVADLLEWLQGQLGDMHLIAGSSLYRTRVGEPIASPLLTLRSRFDAPSVAAISSDGFATPPVVVLDRGVLRCLLPSLYGSRRTRVPHVPVAASGWALDAGTTPLAELLAQVPRGALVGRLSMGNPAPGGEFSGVIKNSFRIDGGEVGPALAETMITGNMARMLHDVIAASAERLDTGDLLLPWLRIGGLHFS